MEKKSGDGIINSLFCILSTVQEKFRNFTTTYIFLILNPIFIKFSLFCLNLFILSIELI